MFLMAVALCGCTSHYLAFAPSNAFGVTAIFFSKDSQTKYFLYESLSVAIRETPSNKKYVLPANFGLAVTIF